MNKKTHQRVLLLLVASTIVSNANCLDENIVNRKIKTTDQLANFMKDVKALNVGIDTGDDVKVKIGLPWQKHKTSFGDAWMYSCYIESEKMNVQTYAVIGSNEKLSKITVIKNNDVIYEKTDTPSPALKSDASPQPSSVDVFTSVPTSPKPGQTYLNTTDSHFYGWNGKEWKQLDK